MSDLVLVALVGAIPATLAAIGGLVNGSKINGVHDAVNGGLAAAKAEIKSLKAEIARLTRDSR